MQPNNIGSNGDGASGQVSARSVDDVLEQLANDELHEETPNDFELRDTNIFIQARRPRQRNRDESLDDILKQRHLTRGERQVLHNPKTDWISGARGDVCKSAWSLEIKDLLVKK